MVYRYLKNNFLKMFFFKNWFWVDWWNSNSQQYHSNFFLVEIISEPRTSTCDTVWNRTVVYTQNNKILLLLSLEIYKLKINVILSWIYVSCVFQIFTFKQLFFIQDVLCVYLWDNKFCSDKKRICPLYCTCCLQKQNIVRLSQFHQMKLLL